MRTIIDLFEESVNIYPDNVLLWQRNNREFVPTTYAQTRVRVYDFAAGLMKSGLMPGDRVTLLSEGRNDWVVSELGILYNGAINVPLSIKLNEPEEIKFRLNHSGSKFVIASKRQIAKILEIVDEIETVELIISLDPIENERKNLRYIEEIIEEGKNFLINNKIDFEKRVKGVQYDDIANICYTSGTTAEPKGIMLSHGNYTANIDQVGSLFVIPDWYTTLLILPWDHSFAHTCGIYAKMNNGASLAAVHAGNTPLETLKNIPKNIKEIKPVFLLSVPALAKNFRKNIEGAIKEKGGLVQKLFSHAMKVAYNYNGIGWDRGKGLKALLLPLYKLYDLILFKKIREGFGGRLKFFVGGGALLDIELQRFFYALGMPMFQGYGLTEASPVISSNNFEKHKLGSSGQLVANLEMKICDENGKELSAGEKGEIVVRGENVMKGYWQNVKATKESLRSGWLYTGDLGYLDRDGFLYVLGRFKSLLIADDGEKFSPEGIEEAFVENSNLIEQCLLYNNQKPYSVCLLVPNKEALKKHTTQNSSNDDERAMQALKILERELNKYRKQNEFEDMFPQRWLPASIAILSEGFNEENHLMNSTLKIVRPKITERYADLFEYLYTPDAKNICNQRNIEEMKKLLS